MNSKYEHITKESLGLKNDSEGIVIVVDLDNTLVGDYFDIMNNSSENRTPILNQKLVDILRKAKEARRKGRVSAIFLLTNNSDTNFIQFVNLLLAEKGVNGYYEPIFDYIMSRNHKERQKNFNKTGVLNMNPPKRLEDVAFMMREIGEFPVNLEKRVYFIDDMPNHQIRNELASPEQYIVITPPFIGKEQDKTDYTPLLKRLDFYKGGGDRKRKTRKTRSALKYRIKQKSRKNTRK